MRVLLILLICILVACAIVEARRHHHKRGKHHHKNRSKHARNLMKLEDEKADKHTKHHKHHHKHQKDKKVSKSKVQSSKKEKHPGTIRQQVRELREKLNKMLPTCSKDEDKCAKGTCCWKGKCKILPNRINQRCSIHCPCEDANNNLYCRIKRGRNRRHKFGRCFVKGKSVGVKNFNFIPKMIEKFQGIENKMKTKEKNHG